MGYYELFELDKKAKPREITRRYLLLAERYHPTNDGGGDEDSVETFNKFAEIYDVLSDRFLREIYDHGGVKALNNSFEAGFIHHPLANYNEYTAKLFFDDTPTSHYTFEEAQMVFEKAFHSERPDLSLKEYKIKAPKDEFDYYFQRAKALKSKANTSKVYEQYLKKIPTSSWNELMTGGDKSRLRTMTDSVSSNSMMSMPKSLSQSSMMSMPKALSESYMMSMPKTLSLASPQSAMFTTPKGLRNINLSMTQKDLARSTTSATTSKKFIF